MKENPKQNLRDTYLIAKGSYGELRSQLYIANAIKAILKRESETLIQECTEISSLPIEDQRKLRKDPSKAAPLKQYQKGIKPRLKELIREREKTNRQI